MLVHSDFDGTTTSLRPVKLRNGIGNGATDIIGKVKIEIVDGDINRRTLMGINAPGEVSRDSDDSGHVDLIVEVPRLLWSRIGDSKNVRAVKDLGHLHPFGIGIQGNQRNRTAPNCGGSKRSHQQKGDRRKNGRPKVKSL